MPDLPDLEERLTTALGGVAGRSPAPGDLVAGARERLRRRRRTTAAVVAAALAVVAVPVGVSLAGGDHGPDRPQQPALLDPVPSGWRPESWRDLSVRVPPEWGHGGSTDWCAVGEDPTDAVRVSRPGVVAQIDCTPSYGYGLHFEEPSSGALPPGTVGTVQRYTGSRFPDGAWVGYVTTGRAAAWVVTTDRTTTRLVLDSAEPIAGVDRNGCPERARDRVPSTNDRVSVCRYDSGVLEQSELLSPRDSAAVLSAVSRTPTAASRPAGECAPTSYEQPVITLQSNRIDARLLPGDGCYLANTYLVGEWYHRVLSSQLLYWALSPGWAGALDPELPAPDRLRTD